MNLKQQFNRVTLFIKSLLFHIYSGFPKTPNTELQNRYRICLSCEQFDKSASQCKICGCNLSNRSVFLNKLAWADQECPLQKWGKIL